MKIITIVGARPQFVKAVSISKEVRKKHKEILVHTGQHYDYNMSESFFKELEIPEPDHHIKLASTKPSERMGEMIREIAKIIEKEQPDLVLVYGDTDSTLAGAIAANKSEIPVAHVEAGLRSFDKSMPEEVNRILTDHVSSLLFCPTDAAIENLRKEGITSKTVKTGDIMFDSILNFQKIADSSILDRLDISPKNYFLTTLHRKSNIESKEKLTKIIEALKDSKEKIIFPAHPRTAKLLNEYGLNLQDSNIMIIEPVSYLEMITLSKNAKKILTDSGGLQKEAFFLGVPCITLRDRTEWVETVEGGWNIVVGSDKGKIVDAIKNFDPRGERKSYYGDGNAAREICEIIENHFQTKAAVV